MKLEFIFIKKRDAFCQDENQFKSLFMANRNIQFSNDQVSINQKNIAYTLSFNEIEASTELMFNLLLETQNGSEEEQILLLEQAENQLIKTNDKVQMFQINTIWDDISMYYGRKLYPQIIEVESLLRKIIYLFMMKSSGSKWLKNQSPQKFQSEIEENAKKNKIDEWNCDALRLANFRSLGDFFFEKYSIEKDSQRLVRKLTDFSTLKEDEVIKLIEQFEAKSNWDRYFSDKITITDLEKKWTKLYSYRNDVAHAKKITRDRYEDAISIIDELREAFVECLDNIQDVKISLEEAKAVEEVAEQTITRKKDFGINSEFEKPNLSNLKYDDTDLWRQALDNYNDFDLVAQKIESQDQWKIVSKMYEQLNVQSD